MADHVDITLWIDRRWKDAIEKHLKDETLQEHLEDVLDELCNQLPEQEYKRISAEIYAEDAARRTEEEAARTYAAYHVVENGQEWYFKTSPGEELLDHLSGKVVSRTNRSHFGSDLCFLPPFVRRIFHCFSPALPAPILGQNWGNDDFAVAQT